MLIQRYPRVRSTRGSGGVGAGRVRIFINNGGSGLVENSRNLFFCVLQEETQLLVARHCTFDCDCRYSVCYIAQLAKSFD